MTQLFEDTPPPTAAAGSVRVFAAGGVGEIGRNMTVFQAGRETLVVDCGVLFPSSRTPGVDLILPDIDMLSRADAQPSWLLLTHGHEDHIGAVPYLLRQYPSVEIIGTRLTLAFARARLSEHGLNPLMTEVREGESIQRGGFRLSFFAVAHSVPDGVAALIEVAGKRIFHTGDFKVDDTSLDGRLTDLQGFAEVGTAGVDLLLSDSTNADVQSDLLGEGDIAESIRDVFDQTSGRVVFACFASNVHRVQNAVDAALASGRRVCFTGRSMVRNMAIAQEMGFLSLEDGLEISFEDSLTLDPRNVAVVSTGSQGEPLSALARMARGQHKITIGPDDCVILSARLIPGNEEDIFRVVNGLSERGARVITRESAPIHASGHAGAVDLERVIRMLRPRLLVPIHGEWRHMRSHAAVAARAGMDEDSVVLLRKGEVLDLVADVGLVVGSFGFNEVYVDGTTVGHVGRRVLRDRSILSGGGLILATLLADEVSRETRATPVIELRGVPDSGSLRMGLRTTIDKAFAEWVASSSGLDQLEADLPRVLRGWLRREYRIEPMVVVQVISLPSREP